MRAKKTVAGHDNQKSQHFQEIFSACFQTGAAEDISPTAAGAPMISSGYPSAREYHPRKLTLREALKVADKAVSPH